MNILILTGRFGMGHIKCAEALRQEILRSDEHVSVETVDLIEYLYPHSARFIYKSFGKLVTGFSGLYNQLNIIAGKGSCTPFRRACHRKMQQLTEKYKPDLVIANLPVCAQYFGTYKELTGDRTPMYVFVTDITFHNEWIAPGAGLYFVGDTSTRNALVSRGVAESRIHVTGIPVSPDFHQRASLNTTGKNVLVMGGGLGMLPGGMRTLEILGGMKDVNVTLVCGSNRNLRNYAIANYPAFKTLGKVNNIPELMSGADVLITKPGGITTFEAIRSETPLYIISPTLEQEIGNARFIEGNNIGRVLYDPSAFTGESFSAFLENSSLLCTMRKNMRSLSYSMEPQNPLLYFREHAA